MNASLILLIAGVVMLGVDALMRDAEGRARAACEEAHRHVAGLERALRRGRLDLEEEHDGWQRAASVEAGRAVNALKIRMCARGAAFGLCFALVVLRAMGVT